jgi:hypothetical protein
MEPSAGKNSPANRGQPVELLCVRPASGRFEKYALGTVIQARRKSLCSGEDRSMRTLRNLVCRTAVTLAACGALMLGGCSKSLPNGAVGNPGVYNYSPSIIEQGNVRRFWWCSQGINPADSKQNTDSIWYASIDMVTGKTEGPKLVLAETPGAWDSAYTCNPKVVEGQFVNPLGDGVTYTYALYYVATNAASGIANGIGVAFSKDGTHFTKYPSAILPSPTIEFYGEGQPSVYNADGKSAITMFYEDTNPNTKHKLATSADGVHFTVQGVMTTNGLDQDDPAPIWGDVAFDNKAGEWYAVYCRPVRPPSTTGDVAEYGQWGVELYKIDKDSLLTGATPWHQLGIMDTNLTGYEVNFIAGIVHDEFGNVNISTYPTIELYVSTSWPQPAWDATPAEAGKSARIESWILMPIKWQPATNPLLAFDRYYNGEAHEVTTGWISSDAKFKLQQTLGHLYANSGHGATTPFYGCKRGQKDYFISLDRACEGERALGTNGYAYSKPGSGLVPLYRCSTAVDHFVSQDPQCEGQTTDELLGYVAP